MTSISEYIDKVKKHGYKKFMFRKIISDGFRNKHPEFQKEIDYLRRKGKLAIFLYEFMDFYKKEDYPAFDDKEAGMLYVMYEGKKLYLHYGWSILDVLSTSGRAASG